MAILRATSYRARNAAHGVAHRRERRHLLLLPALPELRSQPCVRDHARTPGPVRRLQLAGRQSSLRDRSHRPQPAAGQRASASIRCAASGQNINDYVYANSKQTSSRFNAYSLLEDPMTSCGCFEAIVALMPECNGVMIVNREYLGETPAGMKFSTLADTAGGGQQVPGFIGVGKAYITSRKFISAEGGHRRIVWMPKELKETLREDLELHRQAPGHRKLHRPDRRRDRRHRFRPPCARIWKKVNHPALSDVGNHPALAGSRRRRCRARQSRGSSCTCLDSCSCFNVRSNCRRTPSLPHRPRLLRRHRLPRPARRPHLRPLPLLAAVPGNGGVDGLAYVISVLDKVRAGGVTAPNGGSHAGTANGRAADFHRGEPAYRRREYAAHVQRRTRPGADDGAHAACRRPPRMAPTVARRHPSSAPVAAPPAAGQ